jgi:transcriptional regulator with XRE-family HTH domain
MTFREKLDRILKHNQLDLHVIEDLEDYCDIGSKTLRKNYNDNTEPSRRILVKLLNGLSINTDWWDEGKGEIFTEKHTLAIKSKQAAIINDPLVQSYLSEINTLRKYVTLLERENEELRSGKK